MHLTFYSCLAIAHVCTLIGEYTFCSCKSVYLLGNRVSLTLVLTEQAIYLGKENFAQWPLPKVQELPKRDDLKPPFSNVKRKNINDVEQIVRVFYFTCFCMLIIASHMYKPGSY